MGALDGIGRPRRNGRDDNDWDSGYSKEQSTRPQTVAYGLTEGDVRSRPDTFDLLGFTHYWAMSRNGYWVVKQKTAADRFRRTLKRIAGWCQRYRHEPVSEQWAALRRKLLGHFAYFGITGNFQALRNLRYRVIAVWRKWLSRRSQRAWISWAVMMRLLGALPAAGAPHPSVLQSSRSETVNRRAGCGKSARPDPWELRLESSWNSVV